MSLMMAAWDCDIQYVLFVYSFNVIWGEVLEGPLTMLTISTGGPTQEIKSDEAVLREQVTSLAEQNGKYRKSVESLQGLRALNNPACIVCTCAST